MALSNAQIDRLGERLKLGNPTEDDLRLLEEFRLAFADAFATVFSVIENMFRFEVTGRPAKTTASIVAKLQRESIRLSQIQDIAGCRVLVDDLRSLGCNAFFVENRAELVSEIKPHLTGDCAILLMGARDPSLDEFAKKFFEEL